jgi:transposase
VVGEHACGGIAGHKFYEKLNQLLAEHRFDRRVEDLCVPFYQAEGSAGRPSVPPGVYFRMLLIGYFEGIESERGICWRCTDSLSLRAFLGLTLTETVPDQSTLSRTRKRLPLDLFEKVFGIVLGIVADAGLLKGKVVGVDATYLRADASMKAIVRRETCTAPAET